MKEEKIKKVRKVKKVSENSDSEEEEKRENKKAVKKESCNICTNVFNNTFRKELKCPYCTSKCCNMCCRQFILTKAQPQCMECKSVWPDDFLFTVFPKTWVDHDLRHHMDNVVVQQEKSLFPLAVAEIEKDNLEKKRRYLQSTRRQLEQMIERTNQNIIRRREMLNKLEEALKVKEDKDRRIENRMEELREEINDTVLDVEQAEDEYNKILVEESEISEKLGKPVAAKFKRPCPNFECKGYVDFLSSNLNKDNSQLKDIGQLNCAVCHKKFCGRCREEINKNSNHKCDESVVKTLKLLDQDTKPCPSCKVPVYKISGCFSPETKVLMFDKSLKRADEIAIGHQLVGDDGKKRTVLNIMNGESKMYRIKQLKGLSYKVNEYHKLVCKDIKSTSENDITIITVRDYLLIPERYRRNYRGIQIVNGVTVYLEISVEECGIGKYYGWNIDGNHLFLLSDGTLAHNCDQMFCTSCHSAFNWVTGEIETGRIHNPHYFDWLSANPGTTIQQNRENNIIMDECGAATDISISKINEVLEYRYNKIEDETVDEYMSKNELQHILHSVVRMLNHIRQVERPTLKNPTVRHLRSRIDYITNSITEEVWKSKISEEERNHKKNYMWLQVIDLLYAVLLDIITKFLNLSIDINFKLFEIQQNETKLVLETVIEIHNIRKYFNECSLKYALRFNKQNYKYVTKDFYMSNKPTVKEETKIENYEETIKDEIKVMEWMDEYEKKIVEKVLVENKNLDNLYNLFFLLNKDNFSKKGSNKENIDLKTINKIKEYFQHIFNKNTENRFDNFEIENNLKKRYKRKIRNDVIIHVINVRNKLINTLFNLITSVHLNESTYNYNEYLLISSPNILFKNVTLSFNVYPIYLYYYYCIYTNNGYTGRHYINIMVSYYQKIVIHYKSKELIDINKYYICKTTYNGTELKFTFVELILLGFINLFSELKLKDGNDNSKLNLLIQMMYQFLLSLRYTNFFNRNVHHLIYRYIVNECDEYIMNHVEKNILTFYKTVKRWLLIQNEN
jgi:hypothetical protein